MQMMLVLPFSHSVRKRREQEGGVLVVDHFTNTHTHTELTVSHHALCLLRHQACKATLPWQPGYMRDGALR